MGGGVIPKMLLAVCFAIHNKCWNEHFHGDQDVKCGGLGMPRHEIICNKRMHLKITFWMEDSAYQIPKFRWSSGTQTKWFRRIDSLEGKNVNVFAANITTQTQHIKTNDIYIKSNYKLYFIIKGWKSVYGIEQLDIRLSCGTLHLWLCCHEYLYD